MLSAARNNNARGRGGRGGARNGRAGGQRSSGNAGSSKRKDEKKLKKFHPQIKGKHPEYSFDEVKKELIKSMELTDLEKADDIIDSIRNMTMLNLDAVRPQLQVSQAATRAEREADNEGFKEEYRYEMKKWDQRVDALANNRRKTHAKILKFCTEAMEQKLEREADFETTIYRDPIELLKRIKKFMTTSEETDWEYFILWEAMSKLVNCRQGGNETPNEFRKKLEERAKTVRALLGDDFLDGFAKSTIGYTRLQGSAVPGIESNAQLEYKQNAWEMLKASIMVYNCDRSRYQSKIDTMNAAYMVVHQPYEQRMTYPITMHNATETLNRHKHDNRKSKNGKYVNSGSNVRNGGHTNNSGTRAGNAHGNAHGENPDESGTNLAQTGRSAGSRRACFCCGSLDHLLPDCPYKETRPREQWHRPDKYREFSALQTEENNNQSNQGRSMIQTGSSIGGRSSQERPTNNGRSNVQWSFAQSGRYLDVHHQSNNDGLSF